METPKIRPKTTAFSPLEKQVEQENKQETKPIEGVHHAHGTPAPEKDAPPRPTEGHGISHAHGTPAPEKDAPPRPTEGHGISHAHGTPEK